MCRFSIGARMSAPQSLEGWPGLGNRAGNSRIELKEAQMVSTVRLRSAGPEGLPHEGESA